MERSGYTPAPPQPLSQKSDAHRPDLADRPRARARAGWPAVNAAPSAQAQRERKRAQLTESERKRAQLAIDAAGVGVWERDLQGRVLHWNDAMYRLRGFDPANAPSPDELMDRLTHPEDRAALQRVFLQHIDSGEPYRQELRVRGPDGQWTWLLTQGLVMRDEQGQAVGMAGVNIDITERKRAAELTLEKQRIEQASRDKSAFMARMSHELRTQMNAVLGFAGLLDSDANEPPTPRQRERLAHIRTAGKALIDDLLDTAHREAAPASAPKAGALHVLCVEDNPVNLQLVRELLAMRPPCACAPPKTALQAWPRRRPSRPTCCCWTCNCPTSMAWT